MGEMPIKPLQALCHDISGDCFYITFGIWRTADYNRQLLATQQHIGGGVREAGNTGLQQATAGNSATHRMWC